MSAVYFHGDVLWLTDRDYAQVRRVVSQEVVRDATEEEKQDWRRRFHEAQDELREHAVRISQRLNCT